MLRMIVLRGALVLNLVGAFCLLAAPVALGQEWQTIDTNSLDEWGDAQSWWKSEDGAIVADCKGGEQYPKVHYLVWNGSLKGDFEYSLEYRILADAPRDAGTNFRVERPFEEAPNLPGYQAELDTAILFGTDNGKLFGNIHDGKRGRMFKRGKTVTIAADGTETEKPLAKPFEPGAVFKKPPAWNRVDIKVEGDHIRLYLNGVLANEIIDGDTIKKSAGDAIALQCRPVDAYRFEVRNMKYRLLTK